MLLIIVENENFLPSGNFHIVKIKNLSNYTRIWQFIHPIGSEQKSYITTGGFDWSHNGSFVAFRMGAGAPVSYLWTMTEDGKEITPINIPIVFNSIDYIRLSQDDNSIFFLGQYNDKDITYQDIFRYYLNNQSYSLVTKDSHVHSFDLMPDGNLVYVESHSNSTRLENDNTLFIMHYYNVLWLATINGHKINAIYNGTELFDEMSLSPDGKKLVFVSREDPLHPSDNGTTIVNSALMGPVRKSSSYLATYDISENKFTILAKNGDDAYATPRWTSDGHSIIYETLLHKCVQDKVVDEQSCPAGLLNLINPSYNSIRVLYGNQVEPYTAPLVGAAINPNGSSVIGGMNYDFSNGALDGGGIYRIDFEKPLSVS